MGYVPDEIKQLWKDVATSFNAQTSGVGNQCLLTFSADIKPSSALMTDSVSSKPRYFPPVGGMSSPRQVASYEELNTTSASGYYQSEITKVIEGRVYGANKDFDNSLFAQATANVWKFVCEKKYSQDLLRASTATFYYGSTKEFKTKLLRPPVSYGLGQDVNCISYWVDV